MKRIVVLVALMVGALLAPAFAQKYEVHPYVGGLTMSGYSSILRFKNPGIFGLKGGAFVTDHLMIEGNTAWINQFNFRGYSYRTGAVLYEAAGSYNIYRVRARGVVPFVSAGVGGLTIKTRNALNMDDHNQAVYLVPLATPQPTAGPIPRTLSTFVLRDNESFFNFSYGGGIRAQRLLGPLGLRADIRGRTLPNFFGKKINSLEATGGLLFSWGER